jgi:hypothetical protein
MSIYHYNLDEVSVVVMGIPVTEFADGDAVEIEKVEDDWVTTQGHHGSGCRAKKASHLLNIKLMVMQGSPVNEQLSLRAELDERTGLGAGAFSVIDANGTSLADAEVSWVTKMPTLKMSSEPQPVEWTFTGANGSIHPGSNKFVVPGS